MGSDGLLGATGAAGATFTAKLPRDMGGLTWVRLAGGHSLEGGCDPGGAY